MNRYELALGKEPPPIEPPKPVEEPKPKSPPRDTSDPAFRDDLVRRSLQTGQGRMRLATALQEPIRTRINYNSFVRRFFTVEELPDGALPVYDKAPGTEAYVIAENGQNISNIPRGTRRVHIPLFEIASNPTIPLTRLRERPSEEVNQAQFRAFQDIRNVEEELGMTLLNGLTNVSAESLLITNELRLTREIFTESFSTMERSDFRVNQILMNENHYTEMLDWGRGFIDENHHPPFREAGILGNIWDATITVSRAVPAGEIYMLAEPQFVGHMPVRTSLTVLSADDPETRRIGWSCFENLGMGCLNPSSVLRVQLMRPPEPQFMASCIIGGRA
jgi:hypothetical protein